MMKFLTSYLVITGIGAFLALAMPGLVIIGFFLLIIPGLILSLMPTAFIWGCVFTAFYLAIRPRLGEGLAAALVAGVLSGGALYLAAQPSRMVGLLAYQHAQRDDVTPKSRIAMQGDVRIDVPLPRWDNKNRPGNPGPRGFACDNLCIAMLFTPGVTSVTINKSQDDKGDGTLALNHEARTYRLEPRAQCVSNVIKPDLEGRSGLFPNGQMYAGLENGEALNAEWNLRLSNEVCLTKVPAIGRHDILIREVSSFHNQRKKWSMFSSGPRIESVEILDRKGATLLLDHKVVAKLLRAPLFIEFGGAIENSHFDWSFQTRTDKKNYDAISLLKNLEAHTNVVGKVNEKDLFKKVRAGLVAALANPALVADDPSFKIIGTFFNKVEQPLSAEDLDLTVALIRDPRIGRYENIYKLKDLTAEQMLVLRQAFAAKAVITTEPRIVTRNLVGEFLTKGSKASDGSFARLLADEEQLLTDPTRRWAYPGLVRRLADGGSTRVPQIIALMREHSLARRKNQADARAGRIETYAKSDENEGHGDIIEAGRVALCMIGPEAGFALADVEAMMTDGTINAASLEGHSGNSWHLMLARLGKPIESLKSPPQMSGNDASHQRYIREKLARFERKGDC